jgi:histone-lysine N-methyltransferase ASH1L
MSDRFIGEAAATWKKNKISMSKCVCTMETGGCDEGCLNRTMQYECNESNCNVGKEHCANRGFADLKWRLSNRGFSRKQAPGQPPTKKEPNLYGEGVEVTKTDDRGYGVRAMRSFKPNQIIVEYTGEIITQDEADRRMNEDYKGKTVSLHIHKPLRHGTDYS